MNRILFPTDFTEVSRNALNYTLDFARHLSSDVAVLHAYKNDLRRFWLKKQRKEIIWTKMVEFTKDATNNPPPDVSLMLRRGKLADSISQSCNTGQYRYIAMGKKHAYSTFQQIIGTKTSKVMAQSYCPILVIPAGAKFNGLQNILVVDSQYQDVNATVQQHMLGLSLRCHANLHYIHINKNSNSWEYKQEILHQNSRLVQKSIPEAYAVEGLLDYLTDQPIDLVVMMTSRQKLFEELFHYSYEHGKLDKTDLPLLVFHKNFLNWAAERETVKILPDEATVHA
jgi:nucleotide-binding universal stress UspA family protein